jgi:hypothetical protein
MSFSSFLRYLTMITTKRTSGSKQNEERKEEQAEHIQDDLQTKIEKNPYSNTSEYEPNQSGSGNGNGSGTKWCYVGESNHKRTCASVDEHEKCMSGNIFPSYDLCVNPNLR